MYVCMLRYIGILTSKPFQVHLHRSARAKGVQNDQRRKKIEYYSSCDRIIVCKAYKNTTINSSFMILILES